MYWSMNMTTFLTRRTALKSAACGFGYLAFADMVTRAADKERGPLAPKKAHFAAKAKHVIFLCMEGAPSHVDTFDYKPKLKANDGQSFRGSRAAFAKLLASPFEFKQHGKSGLWISELYPELSKQADELCLINGMHTDVPAHPQAFQNLHTGSIQFKRPSLGAWTVYGLGSDNENLPGLSPSVLRKTMAGPSTTAALSYPLHTRRRQSRAAGLASAGVGRAVRVAAAACLRATLRTRSNRPRSNARNSTSFNR